MNDNLRIKKERNIEKIEESTEKSQEFFKIGKNKVLSRNTTFFIFISF